MSDTLIYTIENNLYINLTQHCTLSCKFCPKIRGTLAIHEHNLLLKQDHPAAEYIELINNPTDFAEVVFCGYGEPTTRIAELLEIAAYIKGKGGCVRVNTDGLANLVHQRNVLPELSKVVDALSISMNAQNEEIYLRYCHPSLPGSYAAMLDFLAQAPDYIESVTASAIDGLPGVDIEACKKIATQLGVNFRTRYLNQL